MPEPPIPLVHQLGSGRDNTSGLRAFWALSRSWLRAPLSLGRDGRSLLRETNAPGEADWGEYRTREVRRWYGYGTVSLIC